MKLRSIFLAGPALTALAVIGASYISPKAPSASHGLEEAAADLHHYMHQNYSSSFGSHGMEVSAGALHHQLHEWADGNATECDVITARDGVEASHADMTTQFRDNGVFANRGAKIRYFSVTQKMIRVIALTALASC